MIDVSNRIWSKEDREAWEALIEKMESYDDKLEECPFCGNHPILDDDQEETGDVGGIKCFRNYFEIRCRHCGYSKQAAHTEKGLDDLVNWWNTRYAQQTDIEYGTGGRRYIYERESEWIGKLCRFRDNENDKWNYSVLKSIDADWHFPFRDTEDNDWAICESVSSEDDIIYKKD